MKRGALFGAIYLIMAGITLLLANILKVHFSVFMVLLAEAMILAGAFILTRGNVQKNAAAQGREQTVLFTNVNLVGTPGVTKYTVLFSSAVIELPYTPPPMVEVNSLFSSVKVVRSPGHTTRVRLTAAFGAAQMPGQQVSGFGNREHVMGEGPAVYLEANAVFGSVDVE